ncbi:MAG: copper resistance protein CopC [Gemmatimonadetes bacterium]|nr:copper resistance protein CopC [Gemmatimonadota bacterium]MDA1102412.1 copper resistance protein CopC [Gemmatimonadota bacterium]
MMMRSFRLAALSLVAIATLGATAASDVSTLHFGLSKSSPAADTSVESPSEVRLWFTEEPQSGTTSIRLVGAEEAGVHVMDVVQDAEEPRSFAVELHGTLSPGVYTVSWRGMGADGHVIRETFDFTVVAR